MAELRLMEVIKWVTASFVMHALHSLPSHDVLAITISQGLHEADHQWHWLLGCRSGTMPWSDSNETDAGLVINSQGCLHTDLRSAEEGVRDAYSIRWFLGGHYVLQ